MRVTAGSQGAGALTVVLLEQAANRAGRERTVARAVRAAWNVLVADPGGPSALAVWRGSLGAADVTDDLFAEACLATGSPAGVTASLLRAARRVSGRPAAAT